MHTLTFIIFLVSPLIPGVLCQFEDFLVTSHCLGCICEAASGCNLTSFCTKDVCGPFQITRPYWKDGGSITINDVDPNSFQAYEDCVTDIFCSAFTIQGYMLRYQQDCNNDGIIDCDDFATIHILGPYKCEGFIPEGYQWRYNKCKRIVGLKRLRFH